MTNPPKKTTKAIKIPTLNLKDTVSEPVMKEDKKSPSLSPQPVDIGMMNIWDNMASLQKESTEKEVIPLRGLLFGQKWTAKTHIAESLCKQKSTETDKFRFNDFFPVRIIDCGNGARTIAVKDFNDDFKSGNIIIISPFMQKVGDKTVFVSGPLERFGIVRKLIRSCLNFTTGSVVIDEFDRIENDAKYFIYSQYGIYEKENGELWYREKEKYEGKTKTVVPESKVGGIIPRMYGPRNEQMRSLMRDISMLRIPVILVAHQEAEYDVKTSEATGKIVSNLLEFVEDDMDLMVHLENIEVTKSEKQAGIRSLTIEGMRRATFRKNRFTKSGTSDVLVVERKNFEFSDLFSIMLNGETNG